MSGPLSGYRVVEIAGIGPAPFCATLLADMGAEVIRLDRREAIDLGLPGRQEPRFEVLLRGRSSLSVDLKSPAGRDVVLRLVARADALIEGFRPGVMERLGLGPADCLAANPRLVYGRMTGWGQHGPLAPAAGHDINYIALSGMLHAIGTAEAGPVPPLNLVGDFGGGGMVLAVGVLAALLEAQRSGHGQVVDAAMAEGASYLGAMFFGLLAKGTWSDRRGDNVLDGAAPWYRTYATRDGGHVAVGAIEGRFYRALLEGLGLADEVLPAQHDRTGWPRLAERFAAIFATRTRGEWEAAFAGTDACVTPVLSLTEAPGHPHNAARASFVERDGVMQPATVPRFSRTPGEAGPPSRGPGAETHDVLAAWGFPTEEIDRFAADGIVGASAG